MHPHLLSGKMSPQVMGAGRQTGHRAEEVAAPVRPVRHRNRRPRADPQAGRPNRDRAPEESYRDYIFRTSIRR
jgi:hypothetical protein